MEGPAHQDREEEILQGVKNGKLAYAAGPVQRQQCSRKLALGDLTSALKKVVRPNCQAMQIPPYMCTYGTKVKAIYFPILLNTSGHSCIQQNQS